MSIEDRAKHQKSVNEIQDELIELLIKSGKSTEEIERIRKAKSKDDLLALMHDSGHPYMNTRVGTALDNLKMKNPKRKDFSPKEVEEEIARNERAKNEDEGR